MLGLKRHPHNLEKIVKILIQISRNRLTDLLTVQLKKTLNDGKWEARAIYQFFPVLINSSVIK